MSDEEKKAIEWLKKADWFSARLYSPTILNLIEKQSKEIEELKEKNEYLPNWVSKKYISKDKIKAKIEEVQKIIEFEKPTYEDVLKYAIEVLQSLLEEKE